MGAQDIIRKTVLEGLASGEASAKTVLVTLGITVIIALYIFLVYYKYCKRAFYSKGFNISLVAIAIVTSGIILTMQSNLVMSLGMVGALSIVRFRTAIKDPMDLFFLFWAISTGIVCGAGRYTVALIVAVVVTLVVFGLELTPAGQMSKLLIINASNVQDERLIMEAVFRFCKNVQVKSRNITEEGVDLVIGCKTEKEYELVTSVSEIEGVHSVSFMQHDGDVTF